MNIITVRALIKYSEYAFTCKQSAVTCMVLLSNHNKYSFPNKVSKLYNEAIRYASESKKSQMNWWLEGTQRIIKATFSTSQVVQTDNQALESTSLGA